MFGNVGSMLSFCVGADDAEVLATQLGGDLEPDLTRLPRYRAYAQLLIDGMPSRPFSMQTLPPSAYRLDAARPGIIRRYSQQRYGRKAAVVAAELEQMLAA